MNDHVNGYGPEKRVEFLKHLEQCLGIVTNACRRAGISREIYYYWMDTDPDFAKAVGKIDPVVHDFVETKLLQNIQEGKEASIIYYTKTKMRHRGYVERTELTGADGGPLQVQAVLPEHYSKLLEVLPVVPQIADNRGKSEE
jgi:hypothetical protein